jgi:ATP-dependent 26S proteasome regulatory subunit
MTGAEIKAVCTESGYAAIRENRFKVTYPDFIDAKGRVLRGEKAEGNDYLKMFS